VTRRQERQRPLARVVEQPLGAEAGLEGLDLGQEEPLPGGLEALHTHPDQAARPPVLDPSVGLDQLAVGRPEGQPGEHRGVHGGVDRVLVAEREVHLPAPRAEVADLGLDPEGGDVLEPPPHRGRDL
jgi:hypothetical protein